jgi:CRISPR-associated protein Cmr2
MSIWSDLLLAFLHDPPDKPLDIRGHEGRARRYLAAALGWAPSQVEAHGGLADYLASAIERLPMPKGDDPSRQVSLDDAATGPLRLCHPLSAMAHQRDLSGCALDEAWLTNQIQQIVDGLPDAEHPDRFLALWRLLPERLAAGRDWFSRLPADTRIPDHTIWHHMDITAGLRNPVERGQAAFLSFSLGPVQNFIATARSVRDLWTGSMILSWLTFQAMLPIIESLGPTALVYPSLRGVPMLDLWLRRDKNIPAQELKSRPDQLMSPCLPNRFVAVVPGGPDGDESAILAQRCADRARLAWRKLCESVHGKLDEQFAHLVAAELRAGWDRWWHEHLDNFFDVRTAVLPWREAGDTELADLLAGAKEFRDAFPDAAKVRDLACAVPENHRPGFNQNTAGQWQHRLELSARLMEATKDVRHIPPATVVADGEHVAPKCSLLGSYEQMGPARLEDSAKFWDEAAKVNIRGVRLRNRERLSAVALVKRFAGPAFLARELDLPDRKLLRWDDTATVGAAEWLDQARQLGFPELDPETIRDDYGSWSGQWLHATSPSNEDKEDESCPLKVLDLITKARSHPRLGKPPAYYAVLMIDGDHLGAWLRGERSPQVGVLPEPGIGPRWRGSAAAGFRSARSQAARGTGAACSPERSAGQFRAVLRAADRRRTLRDTDLCRWR